MRKSVFKISNASLFQEIKRSLPIDRKLKKLEARSLVRYKNDSIHEDPGSKNYRHIAKLAQEALERKDFKDASSLADKCASLIREHSGKDSSSKKSSIVIGDLEKAQMYGLIGNIYRKDNQPKRAIGFLKESLILINSVFRQENIYFSEITHALAQSYSDNHEVKKAISYYGTFLKSKKYGMKNIHEIKLKAIIDQSLAYYMMKDFKSSLKTLNKGLKLSTDYFGKYNGYKAVILLSKAKIYAHINKLEESDRNLNRFIHVYTKTHDRQKVKQPIYEELISYFAMRRMFVYALNYSKKLIKTLRNKHGDNQIDIASLYMLIAMLYKQEGNLKDSNTYTHKSFVILNRTVPRDHTLYLIVNSIYIDTLMYTQKYWKALCVFNETYGKLKKVISSNMLLYLRYYMTKGYLYTELKFPKKALKKSKIAEILIKSVFGENSFHHAGIINLIATNYYLKMKLDLSLAMFEEVFRIISNIFPSSFFLHYFPLLWIGILYYEMGKIEQTISVYKYCLAQTNEMDCYNLRFVANAQLSKVYLNKGKLDLFMDYREKCMNSIKTNFFGVERQQDFEDLPMIEYLEQIGEYKDASKLCLRVLKRKISQFGFNTYYIPELIARLAFLEIKQDNIPKAIKYFKKCREICQQLREKKLIHKKDPLIASIYLLKAKILQKKKKYSLSYYYYKRALTLKWSFYDKHNPKLYSVYYSLGELHSDMEEFGNSIICMKVALKVQKKGYKNQKEIAKIYKFIGSLFSKLGDFDTASRYAEKSQRIHSNIPHNN